MRHVTVCCPLLLTWDGSSSPFFCLIWRKGLDCNAISASIPCFGLGYVTSLPHTHTHTHTSIWITKRKNELIDADRTLSSDPLEGYLSAAPPSFAFPSPYFRQCNNIILRKVLALLTDLMKAPCVHACMLLLWSSTD